MKVIGVDPGSKFSGIAILEDEEILFSSKEIIGLPKAYSTQELTSRLWVFSGYLGALLEQYRPETLIVEHTSVDRNLGTTKLLTYFETCALLIAFSYGLQVERVRTTTARKKVLGKGNIKKPDAVLWVNNKYQKEFEEDEAEAIIFALYAL